MTNAQQKPEPAYAYMDVEREFLGSGAGKFGDAKARDALIQFYNVTVGHYLVEMQPKYSYDLWRDDAKFRRLILEEVRVMAAELQEYYGATPNRAQMVDAGKATMRRIRARMSIPRPWIGFLEVCMINLGHDTTRGSA